MKKVLLATILAASSTVAMAQNPGEGWDMTNAQCTNVGTTIFKGQTGMIPHVLAMTTNGWSSSLIPLGLTTGFLDCDTNRPVASILPFIDKNMDSLASDMSRGQGESLNALATLLNIKAEDKAQFNSALQHQFAAVFADDITSGQVTVNIMKVLARDSKLAAYAG